MKIYICIPTLNRAKILVPCIESIAKIESPPDSHISVLLIDNDSEQTAKPVFDARQNFPFPFFYYCQPCRGLSRARNMGVEKMLAGGGDAIIFVDDDMRLPPDYLKNLTAEMQKRNADVARGKMHIIRENGDIKPARRASLLSRRDMLPGNGVLVAAKVFKDYGLRFDERFMSTRQAHVSVRKYRGGWHRGAAYVLRRGIPLIMQIIARIILFPFSPNKNLQKIQKLSYQAAGLIKGLWRFNIRLEESDT